MHDIVEDTQVTTGMILDEFGWRIAEIVDRLTRDRPNGTKLSVEEILNNAYEQNDEEVLLIKCCDRLHNLQTIESMGTKKQEKTCKESIKGTLLACYYIENNSLADSLQELALKSFNTVQKQEFSYLKDHRNYPEFLVA